MDVQQYLVTLGIRPAELRNVLILLKRRSGCQNGKITGIMRTLAMPTMIFIGIPIFKKSLNR